MRMYVARHVFTDKISFHTNNNNDNNNINCNNNKKF